VNAKDKDGVTLLMRAASAGRTDMVSLLVSKGADVNARTSGGVSALMMACVGGYEDAAGSLIAAQADVRASDNQGRTALMAAASSGSKVALEALLKAGADVGIKDASGGTALTYAAAEGQADAAIILQKHGAKPSNLELILAAGRCNASVVQSFVAAGMPVNITEAGTTPLIAAAGGDCADAVDVLLAHGANVNATNSDGWTALIKATAAGYPDVVKRLLAKGADITIEDSLGRTATMYASRADRQEIAAMFAASRSARQASAERKALTVSSPTLKPGEPIPRDYTADGRNMSPPINWSDVPAGTTSIALVCEDPDAGNPPPFVHWVIYNIPAAAKALPEDIPFEPNAPLPLAISGAVQGITGFRRPIYRGPAPPPGKVHHYHFVVYALDVSGLQGGLTRADLLDAIKGHILAQGELIATYERKP
ncbi:MAG TPA: YbhB/YbcL family Raf kinase inhibitor-like protein, partial [Vicinamibacterales bacterium]